MNTSGLFKYETHLHTSEASACAISGGAEMADYYKEAGYSGFVVTDHFFNGNTAIRRDLTWEKRVAQFCKGYENAKKRGDKIGIDVFFGFEYSFHGTEFLVYGLDKEWLLNNPEIVDMELSRALKTMRTSGGMVIHAHPFREADYIKMIRLLPEQTDAVETLNARNNNVQNKRAEYYAGTYGKPCIAGSDIHSAKEPINSGIAAENRFKDIFGMIEAIKTGKCSIIWRDRIFSQSID